MFYTFIERIITANVVAIIGRIPKASTHGCLTTTVFNRNCIRYRINISVITIVEYSATIFIFKADADNNYDVDYFFLTYRRVKLDE